MKLRRWALGSLLVLALLLALAWWQRLTLLKYSAGIYTDVVHPREPNQPVPWARAAGTGTGTDGPARAARVPNIIVILADDLGLNDAAAPAGWLVSAGVPTPHIDSIARDGVRFEQGYAGSAVCTPSRAALLTGRYPWRFGLEFTPTPRAMARVAGPLFNERYAGWQPVLVDQDVAAQAKRFGELGMPSTEVSVARLLKARGYHTVHIGKWHLGSTSDTLPAAHGFDESLNMESGLYLPVDDPRAVNSRQIFDPIDEFLWPNMRHAVSFNAGPWFEPRGYLTDYFTDEAVQVIRANRDRPFFLYLAHWAVHTPLQASREDYDALTGIGDHRARVYAAMVRALDRGVGRVLQALKDEGLERDTLVVFTSDNGAPGYIGLPRVNQPYRGWKLTFFEGGLRVPFVARWPGHIPAGLVHRDPVSFVDLLPTLAAAAGAGTPTDRPIDGVDLLPRLKPDAPAAPERALYWRDGGLQAVRLGRWKLISAQRPPRDWLFDLRADPTERVNLADSNPAKLAELKGLLRAHSAAMPPPLWQPFVQMPVAIDLTLDKPPGPKDEYTYWTN